MIIVMITIIVVIMKITIIIVIQKIIITIFIYIYGDVQVSST